MQSSILKRPASELRNSRRSADRAVVRTLSACAIPARVILDNSWRHRRDADEIRTFNRFYTREIGLLNRSLPATDLPRPRRALFMNWLRAAEPRRRSAGRSTYGASERIVARFLARGLASSRINPSHRKHMVTSLTDAGRKVFAGAGCRPGPSRRPARAYRRCRAQSPH